MKKSLLTLAALTLTASVFGQGQVLFNNRVTTGTLGQVLSPIYGVDPADRFSPKIGGTPTGNPSGTTTYGGPGLVGTGFSASLFYAAGEGASESSLQLAQVNGTTTFRTSGSGLLTGLTATLAGVTGGRVTLQVRAWDNMGGTVTSWAQALQRDDVAKGVSNVFSPGFDVGVGTTQPPALAGLQSFQLFQVVPEPSTIALSILGGLGALVLFRRRK